MQKRVAPLSLATARLAEHVAHRHQPLRLDAGLVARALRAVRAVFRAATGLHREQRTELDGTGLMVLAVHLLGPKNQLDERQIVEGAGFLEAKVMAHLLHGHCL